MRPQLADDVSQLPSDVPTRESDEGFTLLNPKTAAEEILFPHPGAIAHHKPVHFGTHASFLAQKRSCVLSANSSVVLVRAASMTPKILWFSL